MSRVLGLSLFLILFTGSHALAEVWVAECKGLEFRFDRTTGVATVSMVTPAGRFQISKGKIGFDNGFAVRAPFEISPDGERGPTDIGLNPGRGIVYAMQRITHDKVRDAVFCETGIEIIPDQPKQVPHEVQSPPAETKKPTKKKR